MVVGDCDFMFVGSGGGDDLVGLVVGIGDVGVCGWWVGIVVWLGGGVGVGVGGGVDGECVLLCDDGEDGVV